MRESSSKLEHDVLTVARALLKLSPKEAATTLAALNVMVAEHAVDPIVFLGSVFMTGVAGTEPEELTDEGRVDRAIAVLRHIDKASATSDGS